MRSVSSNAGSFGFSTNSIIFRSESVCMIPKSPAAVRPTGIVAIDKFNGTDTPGLIWNAIERRLGS